MSNKIKSIGLVFCALTFLSVATINILPVKAASTAPPPGTGGGTVPLPGNPDGTPGSGNGTGTAGKCDFEGFLKALGHHESRNVYDIENSLGYLGRWQMGKPALSDIGWYKNGAWTAKAKSYGVSNKEDFKKSKSAQDQMMKEWMDRMAGEIKGFGLTKYIGKTIGACPVTWSGLLAGRHLCGIGKSSGGGGKCHRGTSLKQYLESGGTVQGVDGNNTPVGKYVCNMGGLNTPYDHNGLATECSTIGDAGDKPNDTDYPAPTPGGPGTSHDGPNEENPPQHQMDVLSETLKNIWVGGFQIMTSQLHTTMLQQVQIVGSFFDAKQQLETQRLMQQRYAEAHKDYHPSEQMCEIGTFVRNLADTERRSDLAQTALSRAMLDRALASGDVKTMQTGVDDDTRLKTYITTFCSKEDNAAQNKELCKGTIKKDKMNADINFTQSIDSVLTIKMNLLNDKIDPDEENIFAFLDYIFMHDRFPWMPRSKTVLRNFIDPYQDMRSLIAIRSVAQNSFAHIIAEKTQGPDKKEDSIAPFMMSLMQEMGMEKDDIIERIGENPSYYAQMEVLTKKIYQHPEFISNLYDKPANVKRIRAAMTAIKLMQDRDIHKAMMRREMLMSMILELRLRETQSDLTNDEIRKVLNIYGTGEGNTLGVGTFNKNSDGGGF